MSAQINKKVFIIGQKYGGQFALMEKLFQKQFTVFGGIARPVATYRAGFLDNFVGGGKQKILFQLTNDSDYNCPVSYSDADLILLCFDIDNIHSLRNINIYWRQKLKYMCPEVPVVLVGNNKDIRDTIHGKLEGHTVSAESGQAMANKMGTYAYHECSANNNEGISEIFNTVFAATVPKK